MGWRLPSRRAWTLLGAAILLGMVLAAPAHAGVRDAFNQIGRYEDTIVQRVTTVVQGRELQTVAMRLFAVLALSLFILKCTGWALRGFQLADMVHTMILILMTGAILAGYPSIVSAIFDATQYVGQALLAGIAGVPFSTADPAALPTKLVQMLSGIGDSVVANCSSSLLHPLACIKDAVVSLIVALVLSVVLALLCIMIMVVDIWGFWLYAIALAIGPVMLPFTLYKRLAFLFDGVLRFFFGTVIYVVIAHVNLGLVAVAILTSLGGSVSGLMSGSFTAPTQAPINDFADVAGLFLVCIVGVFTLGATGRFANSVISGAVAEVSFGKIAQSAVRIVASPVIIAVTGAVQGVRAKKQSKANSGRSREAQRRDGGSGHTRSNNSRPGNSPRPATAGTSGRAHAPGLSFGERLGAMGSGVARAYRDAAVKTLMRNHGFRRGYDFVKRRGNGDAGSQGRRADRMGAQNDADRRARDEADRLAAAGGGP
ncbi:MAG TPA: type IV secretion system protein [Albitalea sp.]|nr:type IV secretion system protein [Albitalea sp.]